MLCILLFEYDTSSHSHEYIGLEQRDVSVSTRSEIFSACIIQSRVPVCLSGCCWECVSEECTNS